MADQFASLVREFGAAAGLENLAPDGAGECVLGIDDFVVTLRSTDGETLLLYSGFAELGETNREKMMARLLAGNYFFSETAGATLAVSPLNREIQLIYSERLQGLDASGLVRILENFLVRLEYWSGVCKESMREEPQAASAKGSPMTGIRG